MLLPSLGLACGEAVPTELAPTGSEPKGLVRTAGVAITDDTLHVFAVANGWPAKVEGAQFRSLPGREPDEEAEHLAVKPGRDGRVAVAWTTSHDRVLFAEVDPEAPEAAEFELSDTRVLPSGLALAASEAGDVALLVHYQARVQNLVAYVRRPAGGDWWDPQVLSTWGFPNSLVGELGGVLLQGEGRVSFTMGVEEAGRRSVLKVVNYRSWYESGRWDAAGGAGVLLPDTTGVYDEGLVMLETANRAVWVPVLGGRNAEVATGEGLRSVRATLATDGTLFVAAIRDQERGQQLILNRLGSDETLSTTVVATAGPGAWLALGRDGLVLDRGRPVVAFVRGRDGEAAGQLVLHRSPE